MSYSLSRSVQSVGSVLTAVLAVGIILSVLFIYTDVLNASTPHLTHVAALGFCILGAATAAAIQKSLTTFIATVAYGIMVPSGGLTFAYIAVVLRTGALPAAANMRFVFFASLLAFAVTFPTVLVLRRRRRMRMELARSIFDTASSKGVGDDDKVP